MVHIQVHMLVHMLQEAHMLQVVHMLIVAHLLEAITMVHIHIDIHHHTTDHSSGEYDEVYLSKYFCINLNLEIFNFKCPLYPSKQL
jgi:hypothetical protein